MPATGLTTLQVSGVPTMGMSGIPATTGQVFFVDSVSGGDGNTGQANDPMATIAAAYAKCISANGDIIVCAAGHAETIVAAGGLTLGTATGVTIWGLGEGSARPTITFSTSTAASILITVANIVFNNFVFVCGIDGLLAPLAVRGAGCQFTAVEYHEGATSAVQTVRVMLTTSAAANLTVDMKYIGYLTGGTAPVNLLRLVGVAVGSIAVDFYGQCSTGVVEFLTTACTDIEVTGIFNNASSSAYSKLVVDTQGSSKWSVQGFDVVSTTYFTGSNNVAIGQSVLAPAVTAQDSTANATMGDVIGNKTDTGVTVVGTTKSIEAYAKGAITMLTVQSADSTANAFAGDVIGNKTDAAVTAVGTTKSVEAYVKGLVTMNTVQSADSTANAFAGDVVGNKTDAAVYGASTTKSLAGYAKGIANSVDGVASTAAAVMTNGLTVFTIAGGPIEIIQLYSYCITSNGAVASTLQWSSTPTLGSAQTLSGASGSLLSVAAGTSVTMNMTSLATAPDIVLAAAGGVAIGADKANKIIVNAGIITLVIGTGSTTGTWTHHLRYAPMARGVTVTPAF